MVKFLELGHSSYKEDVCREDMYIGIGSDRKLRRPSILSLNFWTGRLIELRGFARVPRGRCFRVTYDTFEVERIEGPCRLAASAPIVSTL